MALTDVLPSYETTRSNSGDSFFENLSEEGFGEACLPEIPPYPVLTPVYNGMALDISPQFVHATLSGISIKHYWGKCSDDGGRQRQDDTEYEDYYEENGEFEEFEWFQEKQKSLLELSQSFGSNDGQPLCMLPKMNYRNSFWDLHRPELCKLTWGQKYVSTATVTEHLHGHLMEHGPLCNGFHTEEERQLLLDKELDEYVRLKVLASPRGIPPDEPFFSAQTIDPPRKVNSKCQAKQKTPEVQIPFDPKVWFIPLADDDEEIQNIHRLKEEFCLTIGRHKRLSPIMESVVSPSEIELSPEGFPVKGEEAGETFFYDWHLTHAEESYGGCTDESTPVRTITYSDTDSLASPCPPLMLDEFCKAAGKVDFSDLRCPDL